MNNKTECILQIKNLTKSYYDENVNVIIENFNLEVNKNEFLCILGPSGC